MLKRAPSARLREGSKARRAFVGFNRSVHSTEYLSRLASMDILMMSRGHCCRTSMLAQKLMLVGHCTLKVEHQITVSTSKCFYMQSDQHKIRPPDHQLSRQAHALVFAPKIELPIIVFAGIVTQVSSRQFCSSDPRWTDIFDREIFD